MARAIAIVESMKHYADVELDKAKPGSILAEVLRTQSMHYGQVAEVLRKELR
jgi:hypothetical protein